MRVAPLPYAEDEERQRMLARNGGGLPPDPYAEPEPMAAPLPDELPQPVAAPIAAAPMQRPAPTMARPAVSQAKQYEPGFLQYLLAGISGLGGDGSPQMSGAERRFNAQQAAQRAEQERADQQAQSDAAAQNQFANQQYADAQALEQRTYDRGRNAKTDAWNQGAADRASSAADAMFKRTNDESDRRAQRDFEFKQALAQRGGRGGGAVKQLGPSHSWDADSKILADHFGGNIPPVWEQRFDALQDTPPKQMAARREQFWKDLGATKATKADVEKSGASGEAFDAIKSFEHANQRLQVVSPDEFVHAANEPRGTTQRRNAITTVNRALGASEELVRLDAEYAKIPITERLGDRARQIAETYEQLKNEHQGIILKIAGSGQGGMAEREEIKAGIPGLQRPMNQPRLRGIEDMLRLNANAMLEGYGVQVRESGADPDHKINSAPRAERLGGTPKAAPTARPVAKRAQTMRELEAEGWE